MTVKVKLTEYPVAVTTLLLSQKNEVVDIWLFGEFHFSTVDHFTHFGAILIKFRGEVVKFTNNSEPNLIHDRN